MVVFRWSAAALVAALVGGLAWKSYAEAEQWREDHAVIAHVTALREAIQAMYAGGRGYGNAVFPNGNEIAKSVIASGSLPAGMTATGESILEPGGKAVRLDGDIHTFWIVYPGVSYRACVVAASRTDRRWLGVGVNLAPFVSTEGERLGSVRAAQFCDEQGDNTLTWRSK